MAVRYQQPTTATTATIAPSCPAPTTTHQPHPTQPDLSLVLPQPARMLSGQVVDHGVLIVMVAMINLHPSIRMSLRTLQPVTFCYQTDAKAVGLLEVLHGGTTSIGAQVRRCTAPPPAPHTHTAAIAIAITTTPLPHHQSCNEWCCGGKPPGEQTCNEWCNVMCNAVCLCNALCNALCLCNALRNAWSIHYTIPHRNPYRHTPHCASGGMSHCPSG